MVFPLSLFVSLALWSTTKYGKIPVKRKRMDASFQDFVVHIFYLFFRLHRKMGDFYDDLQFDNRKI